MNLIKPQKLKKGDTIGLLSVSGDIRDYSRIERACEYFKNNGYKTVVSDTTSKQFRYHSGTDKERVNELHKFFLDGNIDAIVCTRGGYGLLRILDKIDYNLIKSHPKIFCGYSDITALLVMLVKKADLICFHGAMANGDFGAETLCEFTADSFFETLTNGKNLAFCADTTGEIIRAGEVSGMLWGGNLTTMASMAGLDFIPDEKFIFFTEDVNEPAYKIDRMFTQLLNIEKFRKNLAGMVIGQFSGVDNSGFVKDLLMEISSVLKIPSVTGFKISHEADKYTIPMGVYCNFDAETKSLKPTEAVLSE